MAHVDRLQETQEENAQMEQEAEQTAWESLKKRQPLDETAERVRERRTLTVGEIQTTANIRPDLPEILALAESIQERGLLQAPLVSERNGEYEIVAGARRLAALGRLYGKDHEVECDVIADIDEAERIAMMVVENEQRQEIEPLTTARALRDLMRLREHASAAELARSLGLSVAWVQTRLRLLDLPDAVQKRVDDGDLSFTLADLIRRRVDDGSIDTERAEEIVEAVVSGDTTASEVRNDLAPPTKAAPVEADWEDEWKETAAEQDRVKAEEERVNALESQADVLLASSPLKSDTPTDPAEEPATPAPAGSRATALGLAQLLATYESHAQGLGINDPWTEVPALSLREREEMLQTLTGRLWDVVPERFRSQFS